MAKEDSIYDLTVEILLERQRGMREELKKRFKRTKPFRMEPVSREETLYQANEMTPEIEQMLRETMGDEPVDIYRNKINKLARGIK